MVYTLNLGFSDENHASSSLACSMERRVREWRVKSMERKGPSELHIEEWEEEGLTYREGCMKWEQSMWREID